MDGLTINFVLSQRGQKMLVINEFKFTKRKLLKDGMVYWVCSVDGCKANCHTRDDNICDHSLTHNHEADVQKLSRQAISNSCKRKAVDDISEHSSKIIYSEIAVSVYKENITTRDLNFIRHNINRNRLKTMPAAPKNIEEVHKTHGNTFTPEEQNTIDIELCKLEENNDLNDMAEISTAENVLEKTVYNLPQNNEIESNNVSSLNSDNIKLNDIYTSSNEARSRDEYDLFGELVAIKLRSLKTQYSRCTIQNMISNLLYQGEIGTYDVPASSINDPLQYNPNSNYP